MSFTALHYQCCDESNEPTLEAQQQIIATLMAIQQAQSDNAATQQNQQTQVLDELSKLTRPSIG